MKYVLAFICVLITATGYDCTGGITVIQIEGDLNVLLMEEEEKEVLLRACVALLKTDERAKERIVSTLLRNPPKGWMNILQEDSAVSSQLKLVCRILPLVPIASRTDRLRAYINNVLGHYYGISGLAMKRLTDEFMVQWNSKMNAPELGRKIFDYCMKTIKRRGMSKI